MQSKLKVGDIVRIKSWEQMEKEFGVDYTGSIQVPLLFTKAMIELCGTTFEIKNITKAKSRFMVANKVGIIKGYHISEDMVEKVKEIKYEEKCKKEVYTIEVIKSDRKTIVVKREQNKFGYKKGIATLHPKDTYNEKEGLRIALERAFDIKPYIQEKDLSSYTDEELLKEIQKRMGK